MASPRAWSQLAQLPSPQLAKLADSMFAKHMREELLPFSPWMAKAASGRGLQSRELAQTSDLKSLPTSGLADLLDEAQPLRLVPHPGRLREHWPFGRKFALSMSGSKGGELLRRAYASVATYRVPVGARQPWLHATIRCGEVAGEVGARALAILGLDGPGDAVVLAGPQDDPTRDCWTAARQACGVHVHDTGGPKCLDAEATAAHLQDLGATGLIAEPPFAQAVLEAGAATGLPSLRTIALVNYRLAPERKAELREHARQAGAQDAAVCNVLNIAPTRLVFPEAPAEPDNSSGYVLSPDLAHFEMLNQEGDPSSSGELTFTTLSQRGTALVRFKLGIVATDGIAHLPCPHTQRTLPRLLPGLERRR